jgi:glycosyltransferase involved in cell wall biosynthesis
MQLNASGTTTLAGVRVIIVMGDLDMGGAQRQALLLAQYLIDEEKARVEFWGLGVRAGDVAKACDGLGIPWRLVPLDLFARWKDRARELAGLTLALRRARPDVILSYLIQPNVACGLVWRWTGARVCVWNQRCEGLERVGERIEHMAVRRVPWFATNSEGGAEFLVRTLGAPAERVRVVQNIIKLAPAKTDRAGWRVRLGLGDDTFAACMVANFNQYKDHLTLLRAWRYVLDCLEAEGRSGVLLLAGRFDKRADGVKALAFDLHLGNKVRFLDQVDDVTGLLSAVDLAVLSSPSEGSPNGVLEAMAAGLAVAGTDNPGMRGALGPDGYRFLAPAQDPEALANRIMQLASDSSLRAQVASANRLRIENEFNWRRAGRQMASLIIDGLQAGKSRVSKSVPTSPRTSLPADSELQSKPCPTRSGTAADV